MRSYSPSTPIEIQQEDFSTHADTKKYAVETVREVQSPLSDDEAPTSLRDGEWKPGFIARFPTVGFGALFTVILCAIGSIITLLTSDGKSQSHWPKQIAPNVILSGLNSLSSICFSIAIGEWTLTSWERPRNKC